MIDSIKGVKGKYSIIANTNNKIAFLKSLVIFETMNTRDDTAIKTCMTPSISIES